MFKRLTAAAFAVALAFTGLGGTAHAETWQCAPFARLISGISLFGDAWSWWEQATGKYAKGFTPRPAPSWCSSPTARCTLATSRW